MTPDAQALAMAEELVRKYNYAVRVTHQQEHGHRLIALIMDALRAARPTWTDERPTTEGEYFFRRNQNEDYWILTVLKHVEHPHGFYAFPHRQFSRSEPLEAYTGQWARIEMPSEPSVSQDCEPQEAQP